MDEKAIAVIRAVVEELGSVACRGGKLMDWHDRLLALLPREETLEECVEWYLDTAPLGGGYGSHEARRRLLEALKRRKAGK